MKKKIFIAAGIVLAIVAGIAAYLGAQLFSKAFLNTAEVQIRVRSQWTLQQLAAELQKKAYLENLDQFVIWAERLGYQKVKPCTIRIKPGASLKQVIDLLKANRYQTVNVVVRGSMDAESLAEMLAQRVEIDRDSFLQVLKQPSALKEYGFNDTTWQALFIPNTYNLFVSTGQATFLKRMKKEYDAFWNAERRSKAEKQNLTPLQVAIIASIVTKESNQTAEYSNIAGVYINRLRKGMLLQADPTVVFARGKTGRVYAWDLKIASPYNTYIHQGLPPGPLCIPNTPAVEAVLNYGKHDFLYFCAKPDNSGSHTFAETLQEHNRNADAFHRYLNSRGIR